MRESIKLALRYLLGRKLRSALATLAVALGVMVVFGLNGMLPTIKLALDRSLGATADQADLSFSSETRSFFSEKRVGEVRKVEGVDAAAGSILRPLIVPDKEALKTKDGKKISSFLLNGIDAKNSGEVHPIAISEGEFLPDRVPGASGDDTFPLLISADLSERTGIEVGEELKLPSAGGTVTMRVVGLMDRPPLPGAEELVVNLSTAQKVLERKGRIDTIEVALDSEHTGSDERRDEVRDRILDRLGEGYSSGGNEAGSELLASIRLGEYMFTVFGLLALAMGGFTIFNSFRTTVAERRRDIGMLRAIGAPRRSIVGMILAESLIQGIAGTAVGMLAGFALISAMLSGLRPMYEEVLHFTIGGPVITLTNLLTSLGLGLGITLLGGLIPAVTAGRVRPLEALRMTTAPVVRKGLSRSAILGIILIAAAVAGLLSTDLNYAALGALLFLLGLVLIGPTIVDPAARLMGTAASPFVRKEGRLMEGNLARNPVRSAVTASALMISLAILLAMAGMTTSLEDGIESYIDDSLRSDYILMPQSLVLGGGNVGAGPSLRRRLDDIPGVASTTSLRLAVSRAQGGDSERAGDETGIQLIGIDPESYPRLSGLRFTDGRPADAYDELDRGRGVIVNGIFAAQQGLEAGDELTLTTAGGKRSYTVEGVASDYLNMKLSTGYISQKMLKEDFGEEADLLIMVDRIDSSDEGQVRDGIDKVLADFPAFTLFSTEELRDSQFELISSGLSMYYVLILVLAIPSLVALVNTLGINIIERRREIGILRAIGASRRHIHRLVVGESMLLSMLGAILGILSGLWLGYIMVEAASANGFPLPYYFPAAGIGLTALTALVLGYVAAVIPARQAARSNIIESLQYE